jgi:hypothetical protein
VAGTRQGKKHPDTALEAALADPQAHFQLLLDQYKESAGKDAPLPDAAAAVTAAKKKDGADYPAAIEALDSALAGKVEVAQADLENLGKERAKAIQDALLADGQIDPGRVFIVVGKSKDDSGPKVKVELALK